VRELDDITFSEWFLSFGGSRGSLDRMWDPIAYALGFLDCDHISVRARARARARARVRLRIRVSLRSHLGALDYP